MIVRELPVEECRVALSQSTFGRLACCHEGQPYIVPLHFAVDEGFVYSFSMPGQKIDWMRANPRVCLELDSVHRQDDWTSIVMTGRFEELTDTTEFQRERRHALRLLQKRAMWWEPGAIAPTTHVARDESATVVFRIDIEHLSGRRGIPGPLETAPMLGPASSASRAAD